MLHHDVRRAAGLGESSALLDGVRPREDVGNICLDILQGNWKGGCWRYASCLIYPYAADIIGRRRRERLSRVAASYL